MSVLAAELANLRFFQRMLTEERCQFWEWHVREAENSVRFLFSLET